MSETLTLSAETRDRAGKGASRVLRREGRIPAVIYGGKQEPQIIHLEEKALVKALGSGHFFNAVVELTVGSEVVRTLAKDVAFHPVNDRPEHADFFRLSEDALVHVRVPVVFTNEAASPGLKKGGVLNIVHHELDLISHANTIPDDVVVDVTGLDIGDAIHIGQVQLPAGVRSGSHERDLTIATIVAPSGLKSSDGDTTKA